MGKTKVTEEVYNAVKMLTKGGATIDECSKYFKVSAATVSRIRAAESYTEYKDLAVMAYLSYKDSKKAEPAKHEPPAPEVKQTGGALSANYQTNRLIELMKQSNETLILISNKLAFIVDELTK